MGRHVIHKRDRLHIYTVHTFPAKGLLSASWNTKLYTLSTPLTSAHGEYNTPYPLAQICILRSPLLSLFALHTRFAASGESGPSEGERAGGIVVSFKFSAEYPADKPVEVGSSASESSIVGGEDT